MEKFDIFSNLQDYSATKPKEEPVKKLKASEKLLLQMQEKGIDLSQMRDILSTKGNQLIVSCAGSGKTTFLIFKILYDSATGEITKIVEVNNNPIRVLDNVWVCTFLKTGADDLSSTMGMWQRRLGKQDITKSIVFSTLHAEFKRALNSMGVETNIINDSENTKLLKGVLSKYSLTNENGRELNSENINDLKSAFAYTRNRLDNERYKRDVYSDLCITSTVVDAILRGWKEERRRLGMVDFEDLQEMLYTECCKRNNPEVIEVIRNRYNYLYIDEFQDTSQIQYELLKVYMSGCKKVVAIGDDDQCIYSWRGSDISIILLNFKDDFKPTVGLLSRNFRCPENILKCIKPSILENKIRFSKDITSRSKGGETRLGEYLNYRKMAEAIGDLVYEDIKNSRTVAILCRTNLDGLLPALILDRLGKFSFEVSSDGMTLDSYVGRLALSIVKLFTESYSKSVRDSLGLLSYDKYAINNLMKVCKNNNISFWDIDDKDLFYSCPAIAERLTTWKGIRKANGEVEALKYILMDYRTSVFTKESQFNNVVKSVLVSISTLLDYYNFKDVSDFLEELENVNERLKSRVKSTYGCMVRIASVHEYKGKEADSVYVWNDSVDVFPHKNCNMGNGFEVEEERRVHYIANTRAKKINTIMCLKNKRGKFLKEMDLEGVTKLETSYTLEGNLNKGGIREDVGLKKLSEMVEDDEEFSFATKPEELNEFWGNDINDKY